jgi:hypothetical protein
MESFLHKKSRPFCRFAVRFLWVGVIMIPDKK